ncbi:MAG: alpha/beta fold hydrolase [Candidatus Woesearchaeota archaeon]
MIQEEVSFPNSEGEMLKGVIRLPDDEGPFPVVILCHGFASNKDHELMYNLWDAISRAGFACLRFDFTGHGESAGSFKHFTISREVRDLKSAKDFLRSSHTVDLRRLALIGHSLGGSVALLSASELKAKGVVEIAGLARLEDFINSRFSDYQLRQWKEKGYIQLHNFEELSTEILRDIPRHDVLSAVKDLGRPVMAIHGTHDTLVPFENAREIFNHAGEQRRLELIDNADHFFREDEQRDQLIDLIVEFLARYIRE